MTTAAHRTRALAWIEYWRHAIKEQRNSDEDAIVGVGSKSKPLYSAPEDRTDNNTIVLALVATLEELADQVRAWEIED